MRAYVVDVVRAYFVDVGSHESVHSVSVFFHLSQRIPASTTQDLSSITLTCQNISRWIELNFQDISGVVYHTSIAINMVPSLIL